MSILRLQRVFGEKFWNFVGLPSNGLGVGVSSFRCAPPPHVWSVSFRMRGASWQNIPGTRQSDVFFFDPLCRQLLRLGNCAVVVASGPAAAAPEDFSFIFSLSAVGLHSLSHSPPIEKSVDQRRFISSGRPSSRFMLWCRLHLYAQANATPVG